MMLDRLDLSGADAVVSGAGAGIGQASALALARLGCRVHCIDMDADGLGKTETLLGNLGEADHTMHRVDLTEAGAIDGLREEILSLDVPIKALINAVGTNHHRSIDQLSLDDWEFMLRINLTSTMLMVQSMLDRFGATRGRAGEGGSVVNIASTFGLVGNPGMPAYCATKAGVIGLTRQLAIDLSRGPSPIRVNAVCPGPTLTPRRMRKFEAGIIDPATFERQSLLGRQADAEEIGALVAFLASDAASFITGAAYVIDGGQTVHVGPLEE